MSEMYFDNIPGETGDDLPEHLTGENNDDHMAGFPIDHETVISPKVALDAIEKAIDQVKDYRRGRLFLFETIVGPLVPDKIREKLEEWKLDQFSIPYPTLMAIMGSVTGAMVALGLDEKVDAVKSNQRLLIIPFLDFALKEKVKWLENNKPLGWKLACKFYQKNIDALTAVSDNLVRLAALAWTFCPGIGEPEKETGFYNRFVFTSCGGFIDLGHFFNCAIISYLYGPEKAKDRAEKTEEKQRKLRENKWLQALRNVKILDSLTSFFWGYATSADTIEDRGSNYLGIVLGKKMREIGENGKVIDDFVELYPKIIHDIMGLFGGRRTFIGRIIDAVKIFFKTMGSTGGEGKHVDIYREMKDFFDRYDAIDPDDGNVVPKGLVEKLVKFYEDKYNGDQWDNYANKEWQVVIPQELWERVVRGRPKFAEKELPVKIQLKKTGRMVPPYDGDPPE